MTDSPESSRPVSILSTLDGKAKQELNNVRKELWGGSLKGLAFGVLFGMAAHSLASRIPSLKKKVKMNRNTLIFTAFLSGACCSYLGAVVHGKNSFAHLNFFEIFKRKPAEELSANPSTYRTQLRDNEQSLVNDFELAFQRRAEAIRLAQQKQQPQQTQVQTQEEFQYHPPNHSDEKDNWKIGYDKK